MSTPPGPPSGSPPDARRIGDYTVVDTLGRGGMGVVHRCRDAFGREVALKTITSGAIGRLDARLRREAQAICRLRHSNIVGLIAVGEDEGIPFIVMDLVRGESLDAVLARGPLPADRAASIVRDVARALDHAHERGVIHRDVKPANVLIDEHGDPRLSDFGLASDAAASVQLTRTGQMVGTLQYMAPEQADGDRSAHGPHTDVYAAGALLYACLTGEPPFPSGELLAIVRKVLFDDPTPPRTLQPWIPAELEGIVLRCLEKDPAMRWPSAGALADALEVFAEGEASLGEVDDVIRVERRPLTVVAVALGVAAAALALGYGWTAGREVPPEERSPPLVRGGPEPATGTVETPTARDDDGEPREDARPEPVPVDADPTRSLEEATARLRRFEALADVLAIAVDSRRRDPELADAWWLEQRARGILEPDEATRLRSVRETGRLLYDPSIAAGTASARDRLRAAELRLGLGDPPGALVELEALAAGGTAGDLDEDDRWDLHLFAAEASRARGFVNDDRVSMAPNARARERLDPLLPEMPPDHPVRVLLPEVRHRSGVARRSRKLLVDYLDHQPQDGRARALLASFDAPEAAAAELDAAVAAAEAALDSGDLMDARSLADAALILSDASPEAWFIRVVAARRGGEPHASVREASALASRLLREPGPDALALVRLGELLRHAGRIREAMPALQKAHEPGRIAELPDRRRADAALELARCCADPSWPAAVRLGGVKKALDLARPFLEEKPTVHMEIAKLLAEVGDPGRAILELSTLTRERPTDLSGWLALLAVLENAPATLAGRTGEVIENALDLHGPAPALTTWIRGRAATGRAKRAAARSKEPTSDDARIELYLEAITALIEGALTSDALSACDEVERRFPDRKPRVTNHVDELRARACSRMGRIDEARARVTDLLRRPGLERRSALMGFQRHLEARRRRAGGGDVSGAATLVAEGQEAMRRGDQATARAIALRGVARYPDSPDVAWLRAVVGLVDGEPPETLRPAVDRAVALLEAREEAGDTSAGSLYRLAELHLIGTHDYERARRYAMLTLESDTEGVADVVGFRVSATWLLGRAMMAGRSHDRSAAAETIRVFERLPQGALEGQEARDFYARILALDDRLGDAFEQASRLIEERPDLPSGWATFIRFANQTGRRELAEEALAEALKRHPAHREKLEEQARLGRRPR